MKKEAVIEIVYIPISEIHAYENNPRENDGAVDAVARSIELYGVRSPAIIDKDNVILAGHTRIKAAIKLGLTEYPCVRADDLTKNQAKAFRLADNRVQEDSLWDTESLAVEFASLRENGYDLTDTGFDEFEIGGIDLSATDFTEGDSEPADYDTPEAESGSVDSEFAPDIADDDDDEPDPDEEFVCIICCKDEAEKELIAQVVGEDGELKRHYTVDEIRGRLEALDDDLK